MDIRESDEDEELNLIFEQRELSAWKVVTLKKPNFLPLPVEYYVTLRSQASIRSIDVQLARIGWSGAKSRRIIKQMQQTSIATVLHSGCKYTEDCKRERDEVQVN